MNRKTPSRLERESSRGADETVWARNANNVNEPRSTTERNPKNAGPTADWVKLCTEEMTPDRVKNVPNIVAAKVEMIRAMFQAWSMPRRRWTTDEWMNAVATSQGMNEAFSTGSQAQ